MNPADRAELTRLLLERGLEVSCRNEGAIPPEHAAEAVLLGDGADAAAPRFRVVGVQGQDAAALADTIQRGTNPPANATSWKPWFSTPHTIPRSLCLRSLATTSQWLSRASIEIFCVPCGDCSATCQ